MSSKTPDFVGMDHIELFVANALQSSFFYEHALGFRPVAVSGLKTGNRSNESYVMRQGNVTFVLTSSYSSNSAVSEFNMQHGDAVGVIALEVEDLESTVEILTDRGAEFTKLIEHQQDDTGEIQTASIKYVNDVEFKFVQRCANDTSWFGPGFDKMDSKAPDVGLLDVDHVVTNVFPGEIDDMEQWFENVLGFHCTHYFDGDKIRTDQSSLRSKVMQDSTGVLKFPVNEPYHSVRKSQIDEYLEYNGGQGIQHIAFSTKDIVNTVDALRDRGMTFLDIPHTYYEDLTERVPAVRTMLSTLEGRRILADNDEHGHLLQLFTKPVQSRPTLFYEIIERIGSSGFGLGNFLALFEAIERDQYERGNLTST